ncbi:pyocin knob domain-containing protein, partial [Companilactobacillus bobalius]|uniref:pyocin knob domain-containing protein n=1 Tax=Companilactobacillus bobalius TaxID=2801451 RepID=UPI0013025939
MIRIAKISLDVRKDAVINNEPIILRQGENDVTIEATILNGGDETLQINFATFVAKKPDGTIVSNDPANVNGSVISYSVSKHLTESVGKIQDAYFVINNEVTTNGFDISIIPSTQLDDTSVSYIPGIENINKFLTDTENDWLGRIQQMKSQIAGLDIPAEFKLLMNKSLDEAKAQYQPTIDAAEANVENIVADLAAKKLDLETNSDELNATIVAIKAQIASVNSFLDGVQKQIIEANASFTAGQQAQVSQSISDGQKKLTDSIASMQTKFESDSKDLKSQSDQVIADLKSSSDTAIKDMQENQSTAMAKVNQDISNANISIKQLQESAVSKASPLSSVDKPQLTQDANWDDYANSGVYLVLGASGGNNIPIGAGTTWGYLMVLNGSPSGGAV